MVTIGLLFILSDVFLAVAVVIAKAPYFFLSTILYCTQKGVIRLR